MKLHNNFKKIVSTGIVAAVAIAPLVGAISIAQAAPVSSFPALQADHFRGNNGKNDHRNNRRNNRRNDYRRNDRRDYNTYTGSVTRVKAHNEFDMRINGKIYNVYLDGRGPRNLRRDDTVRVTGKRVGNNDIRNAHVTVLRRR